MRAARLGVYRHHVPGSTRLVATAYALRADVPALAAEPARGVVEWLRPDPHALAAMAYRASALLRAREEGEAAGRAVRVGDVFRGAMPAGVAAYPHDIGRRRLYMEAFINALPIVSVHPSTGYIVRLARAARETRFDIDGSPIWRALYSVKPGIWRAVNNVEGRAIAYATPHAALVAAKAGGREIV